MYHTKKRIKNRHYWYLQHSRREGKRVKTTSIYIAPVGAAFGVLKVGITLATNKFERANVLKSHTELLQGKEQHTAPATVIGDLTVGKEHDQQREWEADAGYGSKNEGAPESAKD